MVTLYSTKCPRCVALEKKLDNAQIEYVICNDTELMIKEGMSLMPVLEVDGKRMGFKEAVKWVNEKVGA